MILKDSAFVILAAFLTATRPAATLEMFPSWPMRFQQTPRVFFPFDSFLFLCGLMNLDSNNNGNCSISLSFFLFSL
uniref:Secreted protein n=1 Tax=Nelumbo nucifera TaxID=4432 RepID=A0A822ZRI8_NELNU|nr:TPA_asm: hypothetical protein HUJ06_018491 [Nelumbo nucifera]